MKKGFLLAALVLACVAAGAIAVHAYDDYDLDGSFFKIVAENPIDAAYQAEAARMFEGDWGTQDWVELESKYTRFWEEERRTALERLLALTSKDEGAILLEEEQGWEQYQMKASQFVQKVFYERADGPILGSQGRVQRLQAYKDRVRDRALELLEYNYMLTRKAAFVFGE